MMPTPWHSMMPSPYTGGPPGMMSPWHDAAFHDFRQDVYRRTNNPGYPPGMGGSGYPLYADFDMQSPVSGAPRTLDGLMGQWISQGPQFGGRVDNDVTWTPAVSQR